MKLRKVYIKTIFPLLCLFFFSLAVSSCSPKAGCPASENATAKVNRRGELSSKRGKSQLFGKGAVNVKKAAKKRKKQKRKLYANRRS
ncbi:MAG: hypothetical protein AAF849_07390 [Bacteroidota bacterium]